MKARPWPIVILAALHIFAPLGNLLGSADINNITPLKFLNLLLHTESVWGLIDFFLLLPLAGVAIYLCKKWSYPFFLIVAGLTAYSNYSAYRVAPQLFPMWAFLFTLFLDVVFVGYFLLPAVRRVYVDPRIRWWESKPRYIVQAPTQIRDASGQKEAQLCDISEGGVFVRCAEELQPREHLFVGFDLMEKRFELKGQVVYRRASATDPGYGIQFLHSGKSLQNIRQLIKQLRKSGATERTQYDWKSDLIIWFTELVKHGKGIVPEVPSKPKAPSSPA